ncbi:MAG: hypothetical protein IPK04_10480 [Bdellovibrionales bacterium]|nr:hypothetical protein [Bdellovibrionales bacterium]
MGSLQHCFLCFLLGTPFALAHLDFKGGQYETANFSSRNFVFLFCSSRSGSINFDVSRFGEACVAELQTQDGSLIESFQERSCEEALAQCEYYLDQLHQQGEILLQPVALLKTSTPHTHRRIQIDIARQDTIDLHLPTRLPIIHHDRHLQPHLVLHLPTTHHDRHLTIRRDLRLPTIHHTLHLIVMSLGSAERTIADMKSTMVATKAMDVANLKLQTMPCTCAYLNTGVAVSLDVNEATDSFELNHLS